MLENYSPNLNQYQSLWEKYGTQAQPSPGSLPIPVIASQEEAIQWSLKLRAYFDSKATELNISADKFRRVFIAAARVVPKVERGTEPMLYSMSSLVFPALIAADYDKDAAIDIDKYGLHFDFKTVDDLFLSDESDLNSVITFE